MGALEIRTALRKKGYFLADIAKALDVSRPLVTRVVDGRAKSRRVAKTIATLTGCSLDELWPGQYPESYSRARNEATVERVMQIRTVGQAA